MSTEGETRQVCVLPYRCSICPPLVTRQMSILQIPIHRTLSYSLSTPCFVTTAPLAVKPASTLRRLVHKKTLGDSLFIDMLLPALSALAVAQPIAESPEGLTNYPVLLYSQDQYSSLFTVLLLFTLRCCVGFYTYFCGFIILKLNIKFVVFYYANLC